LCGGGGGGVYWLYVSMQDRTPAISLVVTLLSTLYQNEMAKRQSTDPHQVNRPRFNSLLTADTSKPSAILN